MKRRHQLMFGDWDEVILECYYDSKEDQVVALAKPGTFNYKYEDGRLFALGYYISFGGWTKSFEYVRL